MRIYACEVQDELACEAMTSAQDSEGTVREGVQEFPLSPPSPSLPLFDII